MFCCNLNIVYSYLVNDCHGCNFFWSYRPRAFSGVRLTMSPSSATCTAPNYA
jgi:hypothetical protein